MGAEAEGATTQGARTAGVTTARYGCYYSSPNVGASLMERYRLGGTVIEFPRDVLARAGGRSRVVAIDVGSRTAYADAPRDTPVLLRSARCVVPDDDEAVRALAESLAYFGDAEGARWEGAPMPSVESSEGAVVNARTATSDGPRDTAPTGVSLTSGGQSCALVTIRIPEACARAAGGAWNCRPAYHETVVICLPSPGGPGTPGDGPTAPGGSPCDEQLMPPAEQEGMCGTEEEIFWDALDFIALAWSLYDFADDPSWTNGLLAGADLIGAALPFIPSPGLLRHGTKSLSLLKARSFHKSLKSAQKGVGNFGLEDFGGLASATRADAEIMGYAWVGKDFTTAPTNPSILLSADGLRRYRPPTNKGGSRGVQANFESRPDKSTNNYPNNGHLNISD